MPWCPKCRNEYVEGMIVCADCGVDLVETLEERKGSPLIFGDRGQMERLKDFLTYNQLKSTALWEDKEEGVFELYVSDAERQKASLAVRVFLQQEAEKESVNKPSEKKGNGPATEDSGMDVGDDGMPLESVSGMEDEAEGTGQAESADAKGNSSAGYRGVYQNSAQKAEENRSSGYLLTTIGGIGLIAIVLIFFDVIRLPAAMANKFMVCIVMGALFALFFVMGILSIKSSKTLSQKAEEENSLTNEIKKWCGENVNARKVDEGLFVEGECGEEMKYFKRAEKMKGMISHQFMNLDEGFLDSFIDDYYPVVFEQESGKYEDNNHSSR